MTMFSPHAPNTERDLPQRSVIVNRELRPALLIVTTVLIPAALAYAMVTGNETQVFALVIALVAVGTILARPFWGLILFVALLYTRPEDSIPALNGMRFTLCVSIVTLIAGLLYLIQTRQKPARSPLNGLLVGFALATVLSTFKSEFTVGDMAGAAMDVAKLVILGLLVLNLVRRPQEYRNFVSSLLVFTGFLALYSIYLYFHGGALNDWGTERSEATGLFANPNDLADSIAPGIALALSRVLTEPKGCRLLYLLAAAAMGIAILLTHSRGGMIAMLVVCGASLLVHSRNKIAAILAAVIICGFLLVAGGGRSTNFDSNEESANSRFHFWDNGIDHLMSSPLTGIGYQQFPNINGGFAAHNSFVTCFTEIGLPGYFCYMGCIYYGFRRRKRMERDGDSANVSSDLLAARLALTGYLCGSFWSNHTYNPIMFLLFTLPAVAVTSGQIEGTTEAAQRGDRYDVLRIALLCLVSIFLIKILVLQLK